MPPPRLHSRSGNRTDGATATRTTLATTPLQGNAVHLKVSLDGHETARFFFSPDGTNWQAIDEPISVGLDGKVGLNRRLFGKPRQATL